MTTAIEVRGLSKKYLRGVHRGQRQLLSQVMTQWGRRLIGRQADIGHVQRAVEPFWALSDVSFTIEQGQVVGIIGRNGSGKSTLLKIIAQITSPTAGEIRLNGRTGTLLEVGTGFHPELTGRENVFLNGAILGMGRAEISRKFDEIVDFSGVEAFIDTPVKRYSSGMQTRLAFSVAAHLEPEILIVDEVLAVGDAEFQKKCLGKMNEVSKVGRTVLFVSHNMSAVDQLCNRIIWLEAGKVVEDSTDTYGVSSRYLFGGKDGSVKGEIRAPEAPVLDTEFFTFRSFRVRDADGKTITGPVPANIDVYVDVGLHMKKLHRALSIGYAISNEAGETVYWTIMTDANDDMVADMHVGDLTLTTKIPPRFLNQGYYRLDFMAGIHYIGWLAEPGKTDLAVFLQVEGGMSDSAFWRHHRPGIVAPVLPWSVEKDVERAATGAVAG
ncbi:ABC transporter ATP-binding protein [Bradyrhizobium prioriisuperbiae]|uniref:ABC transporter ATP-binding protein n=1 Tax=Bradyrhizobium prioriisuperbiae TaxID=2854389 RepID=UPI0028EEFACE|nr:ABC transporter ATP-binding protein [Bradyrhizobium prioritasuperba]